MDAKNVPTDLYLQQLRALGAWWRLGSSVLRPQLLVELLTEASLTWIRTTEARRPDADSSAFADPFRQSVSPHLTVQ